MTDNYRDDNYRKTEFDFPDKESEKDYESEEEKPERDRAEIKRAVRRELFSYLRLIVTVIVAVALLQRYVIINAKIPSESMESTIMTGDHIFGNRLTYRFHDPGRYDIVIFRYPDNEEQLFIKRIIGMPGDVVEIRDGQVYVNGSEIPLDDSFCQFDPGDSFPGTNPGRSTTDNPNGTFYVVPEDSYFVLGDNRDHSRDSRYWNQPYVHRSKILGKAFLRYWPLSRISVIKHDEGYYQPPALGEDG